MPEPLHFPRMLSIKEAAGQTGLSAYYLRNLCRSGRVRYVKVGNKWLVSLGSLTAYLSVGDGVPADSCGERMME